MVNICTDLRVNGAETKLKIQKMKSNCGKGVYTPIAIETIWICWTDVHMNKCIAIQIQR